MISLTFSVLGRRLWLFAPIAVLTCTPMYLFFTYWRPATSASAVYVSALRDMPFFRFVQVSLPVISVPFATSLVLSAILTIPVLRQLGYRRTSLRGGSNTAGTLANLFLTILLFAAANWAAYIFFALPAFILIVFLWVVIPLTVIEGAPPIAAFKQSTVLMKGHFWIGLAVIGGVNLSQYLCRQAAVDLYHLGILGRIPATITAGVVMTGFPLIGSVLKIVAYYLLRREKEGLSAGDIGDVFD